MWVHGTPLSWGLGPFTWEGWLAATGYPSCFVGGPEVGAPGPPGSCLPSASHVDSGRFGDLFTR